MLTPQNDTLCGTRTEQRLLSLRSALGVLGLSLGVARHGDPQARPAGPEEERLSRDMLPVRRRDFIAGRGAARRALAAAGFPAGEIPYEGRAPRMPAGSVGAISHSGGVAVAVAASRQRYRALGVDLELRGLPREAAHVVLNPGELLWTEEAPTAQAAYRLLTAFSAKEAAFKAFSLLLPLGDAPTMLRGISIEPITDGFRAYPRRLPESALEVHVHPVGPGVFTWTAVPQRP